MDTILYLVLRDWSKVPHHRRAEIWQPPTPTEFVFRRSTMWAPNREEDSRLLDELLAEHAKLGAEFRERSDRGLIVSGRPDAPLNVGVANDIERRQAELTEAMLAVGGPSAEVFCILIERSGSAKHASHLFRFPDDFYLRIQNVGEESGLSDLDATVWEWIAPEAIEEVVVSWQTFASVDPRTWSWFGDWDSFASEQAMLREFTEAFQSGSWSRQRSYALARILVDRTRIVPLDREDFLTLDWEKDDFLASDRWTGRTAESVATSYTPNLTDVTLVYGLWGLPYVQLRDALIAREAPAVCPNCQEFQPHNPRRHRDRLCDACRTERRRARGRERSRRYRERHRSS